MNIGIDFDNVIVDEAEVYFAYAQKYTIETLKREPIIIDRGDITHACYCTDLHNWTQDEEDDFWGKYAFEIMKQLKLKTMAKEIIEKLRNDGHRIIIITARSEVEAEYMYETIEKTGLKVDNTLINAKEKGIIAKENNIDVFIDDSYNNCKKTADLGIKTYIMDCRTNRDIKDDNIERVYSWPHLYYKINRLKVNKGGRE